MIGPILATLIGSKDARALDDAVASIARPGPGGSFAPWQIASLAAVLDSGARVGGVGAAVKAAFEAARRLARDPAASVPDREAAIGLVGRDDGSRGADRAILVGLLDPQNPQEVQAAAVRALGRLGDPESTDGLLARWAGLGPALRAAGAGFPALSPGHGGSPARRGGEGIDLPRRDRRRAPAGAACASRLARAIPVRTPALVGEGRGQAGRAGGLRVPRPPARETRPGERPSSPGSAPAATSSAARGTSWDRTWPP